MCGISGWVVEGGGPYGPGELRRMAQTLRHRGPDDFGIFSDEDAGVALANNRLAIIDLSEGGHQPMSSHDGDIVLVYNGELYNFAELREELQAAGHRFRSRSDTEVVLRGFEAWRERCVDRFEGMFAFAAWTAKTRSLFLARDPMGIKPLYYWLMPKARGLVFASELKAFLSLPGFQPEVDRASLQQFLEFGYVFSPAKTIFKGVFKVPPGHVLEVRSGKVIGPTRYFNPIVARSAQFSSREVAEQELYQTITKVVSQHLVADVPLGLLLSGGIDSGLVAALAAREKPVLTVSMAFADSSIDERPYAAIVSRFLGSEHREVVISPQDVIADLQEAIPVFDDLFADWGLVTTRVLYRKCRESGIKVVLVGEGSDELFGGYPSFRYALPAGSRRPIWWRLFQLYRHYAGRRYGTQFGAFYRVMRGYLTQTEGDLFGAIRLFESRDQLPNNYVMKVDKASMSVSTEARVPFLDRRVAVIAYRIPRQFLLADASEKHILRSMALRYGLLPVETAWRPKYGAAIATSWMDDSESFRGFARDVILASGGWVDQLGLRKAMNAYFLHGKRGYAFPNPISVFRNVAWRLLLLSLWSRSYLGRAEGG